MYQTNKCLLVKKRMLLYVFSTGNKAGRMKIRDLSQAGDALYCQALVTIEYMVLLPFLILARFTVKVGDSLD